jgi:hypothetical protein
MDTLSHHQRVPPGGRVGQLRGSGRAAGPLDRHGQQARLSIEKRLRVRLLNRNSHKLSLTEPGKLYFEPCKRIWLRPEATGRANSNLLVW